MKFRGTKGKWHVLDFGGRLYIQDGEYYEDGDILDTDTVGLKTAQANALLISKAPEMLEMLKTLLDNSDVPNEIYDQAKQIIKEATEINQTI